MAKGKDSSPSIRKGLKREFEFALKSQAEMSESMGRTRSAKPRTESGPRNDSDEPKGNAMDNFNGCSEVVNGRSLEENRKYKNFVSVNKEWTEQQAETNVDQIPFSESNVTVRAPPSALKPKPLENDVATPAPKLKAKHSRPVKKFPSTLKELLDTGLLEGKCVRYLRSKKARESGDPGVRGVIQGSVITCHCTSCNGTNFLSPTLFELHVGSSNKRPPEYLFLDNSNSLRDVINACKDSLLVNLEETVKRAIGISAIGKCTICFRCQGSILDEGMLFCNSCLNVKESWTSKVEDVGNRMDVCPKPVFGFTPKSSNSGSKCNSSQRKSQGRITMKDNRLHKLVFDEDVLPDGTELAYYSRGLKSLTGYKKGYGITCNCCNSEVSPSQFEAHAGHGARRKPYLHIYTSNGVSLHELALSLTKGRKSSSNGNDDLCYICRTGGDLVCCHGCPRAFHGQCINLPSNVGDNQYCKLCRNLFAREQNKKPNADALAAGRVEGIDSIQQIANRCIRMATAEAIDFGGCALCRGHEFSKSGFDSLTVLICDQCEKEFHVGCLKEHGIQDLKELPEGMWFCCAECENINHNLQKVVKHGLEKLPEVLLLNVIKKQNSEDCSESEKKEIDVKWTLVNCKLVSNEGTDLLLSQAASIFHNRFTSITDPVTGRDLILEMLYGNNIMGQDFSRMYCAILTVNQCVASAAIFRVFGSELVELALAASNAKYQGQGYFLALFSCVEGLLGLLNVRNIVLPAAVGAELIWTNKFGFSKLPTNELNEYKRQYQMTVFQGTSVLRKSIPKCLINGE